MVTQHKISPLTEFLSAQDRTANGRHRAAEQSSRTSRPAPCVAETPHLLKGNSPLPPPPSAGPPPSPLRFCEVDGFRRRARMRAVIRPSVSGTFNFTYGPPGSSMLSPTASFPSFYYYYFLRLNNIPLYAYTTGFKFIPPSRDAEGFPFPGCCCEQCRDERGGLIKERRWPDARPQGLPGAVAQARPGPHPTGLQIFF